MLMTLPAILAFCTALSRQGCVTCRQVSGA
jgi:hypothetical protein